MLTKEMRIVLKRYYSTQKTIDCFEKLENLLYYQGFEPEKFVNIKALREEFGQSQKYDLKDWNNLRLICQKVDSLLASYREDDMFEDLLMEKHRVYFKRFKEHPFTIELKEKAEKLKQKEKSKKLHSAEAQKSH